MSAPARWLGDLLGEAGVVAIRGDVRVRITGITHDSRLVVPGTLFVAYRGVFQDVHRYIPDALARGAAAALVERPLDELVADLGIPAQSTLVQVASARLARSRVASALHGHPSRDLAVVGVTGTDGKTTTSTLVHAIVTASGRGAGLVSSVGAQTGGEVLDTGLHTTTPEAEDVHALLAEMRDAGIAVAVLEVTSHGLDQHRVTDVAFDVAAITNITHEALEYHETFAAYRAAKAKLFQLLSASPRKPDLPKTAVLNMSDASYRHLAAIPVERRITYSLTGPADFRAEAVTHSANGLRFTALTPAGPLAIRSNLVGHYNVNNILAALAVAHALDVPAAAWSAGVTAVRGIPGRMELVDEGQPFLAVVDFAHTPNALRHALETARELLRPAGRVIAVFGCAGLRDATKRAVMGRTAGELADLTFVTAEDPRTEALSEILAAVAAGVARSGSREGQDFWRVPDRFEAIRRACLAAGPADVVILLGKGHEQSMCFGETEYPWDDRLALRAALRGETYGHLPTRST